MKNIRVTIFLILFLTTFFSCRTLPSDPSEKTFVGREMWTVTNLRYNNKNEISWRNQLDGKILSVGTTIRLKKINSELAVFADNEDNQYTLYWRASGMAYKGLFEEEVYKYFTFTNPQKKIEKLQEEEREAIVLGNVKKGMSKEVTLYACGYPPGILEPLKENLWSYWSDSDTKYVIYFDEGLVVKLSKF